MLLNLLVKHGEIILSVKRENGNLVFIVKDNGSGISIKDLPRVKDKFYKGQK